MFDLIGFTYILRFSRFSDFQKWSRFHHRKILWKRAEKQIVLDSKFDLPNIQRFHADPTFVKQYRHVSQLFWIYYGLFRFFKKYKFRISKTNQDSTIEQFFGNVRRNMFWVHHISKQITILFCGPQGHHILIPKLPTTFFQKCHLMFCNIYWYHINNNNPTNQISQIKKPHNGTIKNLGA